MLQLLRGDFCNTILPKADNRAGGSLSPLCATSGCEQLQQGGPLFNHLVGEREQLV
jgi:hypothetical protein